MRPAFPMRGPLTRGLSVALFVVAAAASVSPAARGETRNSAGDGNRLTASHSASNPADGVTPHIDAVLYDPAVQSRIEAWGLTVADVQHDIDSLQPAQRLRLAYLLNRRWRSNETHSAADLKAQFLVMLSLMRESTLFASVIASGPARLLQ